MSQHTEIFTGRILGGRYKLLSQIAAGGMGEVWRARDQVTGKTVAAKVLRPELSGEEISLSRLRLEAQNTMTARHPNIAAVLDSGEDNGQGWIIMELVSGRPLTDYIGGGKTLTPEELIPILVQTAYALDAAARADVVHRDIKPANIMVSKDGLVKLTDFGISFAKGQANLTAAGMVMGTAQYLAPEQALGQEAAAAGDLYSLGIIAFEALQGRRPFTGKTQVDIAMAHVKQPVPNLPEDVPPDLAEIVYNLLSKDPQDRPASGAALVRSLISVARDLNITNPTWIPDSFYEKGEQTAAEQKAQRVAKAVSGSNRASASAGINSANSGNRTDGANRMGGTTRSGTDRSNSESRALTSSRQPGSMQPSGATVRPGIASSTKASASGVRVAKSGGAAQLTSASPQGLLPSAFGAQNSAANTMSGSRSAPVRSYSSYSSHSDLSRTPMAPGSYADDAASRSQSTPSGHSVTSPASSANLDRPNLDRPLPPRPRPDLAADQTMFLDRSVAGSTPVTQAEQVDNGPGMPPTFAPHPIRTASTGRSLTVADSRYSSGQNRAITYTGRQSARELQLAHRSHALAARSGRNLDRHHNSDQGDESSSRWGLFLIAALVILTVVLIVIAILTGDSDEEAANASGFMQVAWSWEVNTW